MPIHYATPLREEQSYDSICNLIETALSFCDHKLPKSRKEIIDSLIVDLPIGPGYSVQPDCRCIIAEYFIHDLEMAHHQYVNSPFKDSIRLEQYLEFILPYRALDGMCLHDWRSYLFKTYCHRLNSVKDLPIKTVVDSILDTGKLTEYGYDYAHKLAYRKILEYEVSENGPCQVRAQYNRMLMAAYGIPCAIDYVPVWGNINGRHVWSCILTKNESLPFDPFPYPQKWNLKASYNNVNYDDDYGKYRLPKVFRECYSQNDLLIHKDKGLKIPNGLLKRNFMDVSEEYFQPVDVTIEMEEAIPSVINYLYICAYYKGQWEPVWFGKRDGNRVTFEKMGHDIIYTVGYYEKGMIKIVGHPFYVNKDGIAESVIPDFNIKRTISFNRTQRTKPKDIYKKNTLFGCQLQATNDESWQKFDTLVTITYPIQSRVNTMVIDSEECYRYIRLWFPRDTVCMSEISIETAPGYDFKGIGIQPLKMRKPLGNCLMDLFPIIFICIRRAVLLGIISLNGIWIEMLKSTRFHSVWWNKVVWMIIPGMNFTIGVGEVGISWVRRAVLIWMMEIKYWFTMMFLMEHYWLSGLYKIKFIGAGFLSMKMKDRFGTRIYV
ncbi:hypothetical protein DMA11_18440 [Marinilabiliaceae bacterium JC017]|nr:hypothetical protein DMA11_18440 [Marinilabiliaceae bacterium JC017]